MNIIERLASEFKVKTAQVENTVALIDEGNTIPFIARYRKEVTGGLTDVTLRDMDERLQYLRNLEARKEEVIRLIDEQGKLTEELKAEIEKAEVLQRVEDLYKPFKQKKATRASKAKERGLEPLAMIFFAQQEKSGSVEELAAPYVNPEKEVETVEAAIQGAMDIIAEAISDDADARKRLREIFLRNGTLRVKAETEEDSVYRLYYDFELPLNRLHGHQILAINRGEKEEILNVSAQLNEALALPPLVRMFVIPGRPAGCRTVGLTDGKKCTVCGQITVWQEEIPVGDHYAVEVEENPATCWRTGTTAGTKCGDCGEVLSGMDTLPLADHTPVDDPGEPSTVTSCGIAPGVKCAVCEEWLSGGEETPELMFMIRESHVEEDELFVTAEVMDGSYLLLVAFYDENDAMLGIDMEWLYADLMWDSWNEEEEVEPLYDLTFTMPAKADSFRIFVLYDPSVSGKWKYCAACDPRGGEI